MKTKRHKKENHNLFFSFAWLVASQEETATIDFSFWGFSWTLVRDPLQGKPEFRTWASSWNTRALAIRRWARKRKTSKWKIKDFNLGGWPQSHAIICQAWPRPARSCQILAIKKEKLLGVLATCTNYREAFTNLSAGSGFPKRRLTKSGIQFFRLPVFTEPQVLPGTFNARKKNFKIFLRVRN